MILIAGGCVLREQSSQTGAERAPALGEAAASPWLQPQAQISQARRLTTTHGVDVRQAAYVHAAEADALQIAACLRDYNAREPNKPDGQELVLLDPASGERTTLQLPEHYLPMRLHVAADLSEYCLTGLELDPEASLAAAPTKLLCYGAAEEIVTVADERRLFPLGYSAAGQLCCLPVATVQLDGGLPVARLDWTSPPGYVYTHDGVVQEAGLIAFAAEPDGQRCAGYRISYDPALPAQAAIEYAAYACPDYRCLGRWTLPYHVSYSAYDWQPPLIWADANTLLTVAFRPDAYGPADKPGSQGLFRLISVSCPGTDARLIADDLPADVGLASTGGVVFYTRPVSLAEGRWELWVAGLDGLNKQLLWRVEDSVLLSVEAATARRVLVHRQYFEIQGGEPQLHSELREFSLDPLAQTAPRQATLDERAVPHAEERGEQEFFTPPGTGDQPPPIQIP